MKGEEAIEKTIKDINSQVKTTLKELLIS